MRRIRRWPLETFWGNVLVVLLMGDVMYHVARRDGWPWLVAYFWCFLLLVNSALNMAIIVAAENRDAATTVTGSTTDGSPTGNSSSAQEGST
jgi:hypothetical protein